VPENQNRHLHHPKLGRIHLTNHLIKRCCERVYGVKNKKFINHEIRIEACKWLRLGLVSGKQLKQYRNHKGRMLMVHKNERVIQVGNFIIHLIRNGHDYVGQTITDVTCSV